MGNLAKPMGIWGVMLATSCLIGCGSGSSEGAIAPAQPSANSVVSSVNQAVPTPLGVPLLRCSPVPSDPSVGVPAMPVVSETPWPFESLPRIPPMPMPAASSLPDPNPVRCGVVQPPQLCLPIGWVPTVPPSPSATNSGQPATPPPMPIPICPR